MTYIAYPAIKLRYQFTVTACKWGIYFVPFQLARPRNSLIRSIALLGLACRAPQLSGSKNLHISPKICTKSAHFKNLHISRNVAPSRAKCSQTVPVEKKVNRPVTNFLDEENGSLLQSQAAPMPVATCLTKNVSVLCRFCADFV